MLYGYAIIHDELPHGHINMKIAKISMVIVSALAIAGCASFNTPMRNASGQVAECKNSGFGWLGTPVAFAM